MAPPGPVAEVVLINRLTGARTAILPGKVDTGSDVTLIPITVVDVLRPEVQGTARVWGSTRTRVRCFTYHLAMSVEQYDLPLVSCMATHRDNVLLGRNVLNLFVLTLDGPNLTFTLER